MKTNIFKSITFWKSSSKKGCKWHGLSTCDHYRSTCYGRQLSSSLPAHASLTFRRISWTYPYSAAKLRKKLQKNAILFGYFTETYYICRKKMEIVIVSATDKKQYAPSSGKIISMNCRHLSYYKK